ncbi:MAG: plastocyanin/azurin family copper-binding protein [Thaumarchaeota archaeon]|nr:plastocyanin/azurin family copper-binding protein [Nitrososphaerota archaeon]
MRRRGVSSKVFVGSVLVLLIAALSEGVYFYTSLNQQSNSLTTIVSQLISPTTITRTQNSTVTSTQTLVTSGVGITSFQTVTVTSTTPGYRTGLFFNTTLIIIPKGIADNQSENYVPSNVRVKVGVNNSVTWINQDNLSQHTVVMTTIPNGGTQVDLILGTNETYTVKFTVPGVYDYYCMWHPGWMKGTITVMPAGA